MLLTELVENVVYRLNQNKSVWVPNGKSVVAKPCIDWVTEVYNPGFKVLVVPELNQYLADETNSREWIKNLEVTKYLSILVNYTFEKSTYNDTAATWDESKLILDTKEHIEKFLIRESYQDIKMLITDIESQPINEQELDRRNFNAIITLGFNDLECSSTPRSNSLSNLLTKGTSSAEERVSIRRAALSERKLGRR